MTNLPLPAPLRPPAAGLGGLPPASPAAIALICAALGRLEHAARAADPGDAVAAAAFASELTALGASLDAASPGSVPLHARVRHAVLGVGLAQRFGGLSRPSFSEAAAAVTAVRALADRAAGEGNPRSSLAAQEARVLDAANHYPQGPAEVELPDFVVPLARVLWDFHARPDLARGPGGALLAEAALWLLALHTWQAGDGPLEHLVNLTVYALRGAREPLLDDGAGVLLYETFGTTFAGWEAAWRAARPAAEDEEVPPM